MTISLPASVLSAFGASGASGAPGAPGAPGGTIRELPAAGRPRERLLRHGGVGVSDSELVAVLLRTGVVGASALDLARQVLDERGGLCGLIGTDAVALRRHGL